MKTESEVWFEDYLGLQGYSFEYEPLLETSTKPDYKIERNGLQAIIEVKEFETSGLMGKVFASAMTRPPGSFGPTFSRPIGRMLLPVRTSIAKASKQLKPLAGLGIPLVVVLANPSKAFGANLKDHFVLSAMFGDLVVVSTTDSAGQSTLEYRLDKNEQMTTYHPHISAVVVLERDGSNEQILESLVQGLYSENPSISGQEVSNQVRELERKLGPETYSYRCTAFETGSSKCTPLPTTLFDSLKDARWSTENGRAIKIK